MSRKSKESILLTPGPISTSKKVKRTMMRDWGSRDGSFLDMTSRVRMAIEEIGGRTGETFSHSCVPIQGSGTFAVEAAITSLIPRDGKVLILVNGSYGRRICEICEYHSRSSKVYETDECSPPSLETLTSILAEDTNLTDVVAVHCETTSGILNPINEIAKVVKKTGRRLIIDAMSSFGALSLNIDETPCVAVIASSNKCLEGVPGVGFVLAERDALQAAKGVSSSLSLDLHEQWVNMESTGQWRFTPPTHVIAALDRALIEHAAEGGVSGRFDRYQENCKVLVAGMRDLGFETYLPDYLQAPIIVTFLSPNHDLFHFGRFYELLKERGFTIYPGKLTAISSFRIGCIGNLDSDDMCEFVGSVKQVISTMGITL